MSCRRTRTRTATGSRRWQTGDGLCEAVLHAVFSWLRARELASAGAACRAWRRAAAAPALWRRLLSPLLSQDALRSLAADQHLVSWREEYVRSFAGWERMDDGARRAPSQGGARHAALTADGRLALVSEDAELAIWQVEADGAWKHCWSTSLRAHGWATAERAQWAGGEGGARLLLAGALALADSWELMVLQLNEEGGAGRVLSRARCSGGAAGCWAGGAGEAYLSLELRLWAPRLACTTVWLNAATQETESEYAGVTSPLLRIYNEGGAHITLAAVVEVPPEPALASGTCIQHGEDDDEHDEYSQAIMREAACSVTSLLLTGSGTRGAGALSAWWVRARRPAPLRAAAHGELAARRARAVAAARRTPLPAPPPPPPPSEAAVRALCDEPHATCALPAPPAGLAPLPTGRGAWVSLSDGSAWCVSLPALRVLRCVRAPPAAGGWDVPLLHYVQPAVSELYLASPAGSLRGAVHVWSARSGAACSSQRAPRHATPAAVAMLPAAHPARPVLLVLAGDAIHVWRSRATRQPCADELP